MATSPLEEERLAAICLTLSLFKLNRAVSEPEKKAEKQSSIAKPMSLIVMGEFLGSQFYSQSPALSTKPFVTLYHSQGVNLEEIAPERRSPRLPSHHDLRDSQGRLPAGYGGTLALLSTGPNGESEVISHHIDLLEDFGPVSRQCGPP